MGTKIYRNGKQVKESTQSILVKNSGIFLVPALMALIITRGAHRYIEYDVGLVDYSIFASLLCLGLLGYIYRTLTRVRPLAYIEGNILTVNHSLIFSKKVDLSKVTKISCQAISDHNQLLKIKIPGEVPIEVQIRQSSCSKKDLADFISNSHDIEVTYA